jgi:hypothetical protein
MAIQNERYEYGIVSPDGVYAYERPLSGPQISNLSRSLLRIVGDAAEVRFPEADYDDPDVASLLPTTHENRRTAIVLASQNEIEITFPKTDFSEVDALAEACQRYPGFNRDLPVAFTGTDITGLKPGGPRILTLKPSNTNQPVIDEEASRLFEVHETAIAETIPDVKGLRRAMNRPRDVTIAWFPNQVTLDKFIDKIDDLITEQRPVQGTFGPLEAMDYRQQAPAVRK